MRNDSANSFDDQLSRLKLEMDAKREARNKKQTGPVAKAEITQFKGDNNRPPLEI